MPQGGPPPAGGGLPEGIEPPSGVSPAQGDPPEGAAGGGLAGPDQEAFEACSEYAPDGGFGGSPPG